MLNFLQGILVTGGVGFSLVAIGLYIETRWIGLPHES